jgi:hypothetical protein
MASDTEYLKPILSPIQTIGAFLLSLLFNVSTISTIHWGSASAASSAFPDLEQVGSATDSSSSEHAEDLVYATGEDSTTILNGPNHDEIETPIMPC